jgi:hypothetical protein
MRQLHWGSCHLRHSPGLSGLQASYTRFLSDTFWTYPTESIVTRFAMQTPAYGCRKCTLVQREPRPLITTRIRRLRKLGTARDMGMSGGPAGELRTYQMRRGKRSCRRYGGSGALPAAGKSWEDGSARFLSARFRTHRIIHTFLEALSHRQRKSDLK